MAARKPRKPLPQADWSFGPGRSPMVGAVNAGFAAVNVTAVCYEIGSVSPWWGLGAGALAAATSVVALVGDNRLRHTEGRAMCYRAACWMGAGIWSAIQLDLHPWSWGNVGILAACAVAAGSLGTLLRRAEAKHAARLVQSAPIPTTGPQAAHVQVGEYWQALMRRICKIPGLRVVGVEMWPTGDGFTLDVQLPDDGTTYDDIKDHITGLATAAGLEPGCNVEVFGNMPGLPRLVAHVKVNTRNQMADDQPYPTDLTPRSIVDPVGLGLALDHTEGGISLYQDSAAVVGQKGSGKSTGLRSIITGVGRCTDAIIMVIDKKGRGELPRDYQRAHFEGRAERPVIELVANTDKLAEWMVLGLEQVALGRPGHYAPAKLAEGTDKLEPRPQRPQIILVVDEFKSLPDAVRDGIEQLSDLGRSAAIEVVCCALEATASGLPNSILKQMRERVGLRFTDEEEIQYLFSKTWRHGRFDPSTMTDPGMMLVSTNAGAPIQVKGYSHTPAWVDEVAVRLAPLRPGLDEASLRMFNTIAWRRRDADGDWKTERVTDLFERIRTESTELMFAAERAPQKVGASMASTPQPEDPQPNHSTPAEAAAELAAANSSLDDALAAAMKAADEADAAYDADPDRRPGTGDVGDLDAILGAVPSPRERYVQLLKEFGPTGATEISSRMRLDGYSTTRQTVVGWLDKDRAEGNVTGEGREYRWVGP